MLILVTGGAASGKSEHAERLVCEKAQSRLYLATMQPFGKSAEARIARHRALRAGKGFATVERTLDLANLRLSRQYDGILLEDLGNLLSNELFAPEGYVMAEKNTYDVTVAKGEHKTLDIPNDKKSTITIEKIDSVTLQPLEGVVFEVSVKNGKILSDRTTPAIPDNKKVFSGKQYPTPHHHAS